MNKPYIKLMGTGALTKHVFTWAPFMILLVLVFKKKSPHNVLCNISWLIPSLLAYNTAKSVIL